MFPLEITFRGFKHSDAVYKNIQKQSMKLERVFNRIHSCRVVVDLPHRHHKQGKIFHVTIQARLPGKELVVSHEPEKNKSHEDIYVTIRDAFQSMKNELKHYARKMRERDQVPENVTPPKGTIGQLFPADGYGFIVSAKGDEIYFHENSVLGEGFESLNVGDEVRFHTEIGAKGPQASSLQVI